MSHCRRQSVFVSHNRRTRVRGSRRYDSSIVNRRATDLPHRTSHSHYPEGGRPAGAPHATYPRCGDGDATSYAGVAGNRTLRRIQHAVRMHVRLSWTVVPGGSSLGRRQHLSCSRYPGAQSERVRLS
uniref:Uncharacterized protein n=1 Tax=Cacopsylla melanoneura TaxID=428564 RepID=A0A8D9A1Z9_9HEMI